MPRSILGLVATLGIAATAAGCGGERPFVITKPRRLADLYVPGEITDTRGDRWNVPYLRGIVLPLEDAAEAFEDAGDFLADLGEVPFYVKRVDGFEGGVRFAVDVPDDIVVEGLPEGIARTNDGLEPAGRVAIGGLAVVGGVGYAVAAPPLQVVARPVGAGLYAAGAGVAWPAA